MHIQRREVAVALVVALMMTASARAQSMGEGGSGGIAPLPPMQVTESDPNNRIAPEAATEQRRQMLSTQPATAPTAPKNPFTARGAPVPFGRGEAPARPIPSGPHTTTAVPVANVDAIEASDAAPPTPVAPEADPANEDPTQPTEANSPIFDADARGPAPRKILLRALNKVTAQSVRFEVKPGETVSFGQIDITAVTCRTSTPTSQRDDAGLMDVVERVPGTPPTTKPVFRGWMYASSPSVSALEHPIYDVTMVMCDVSAAMAQAPEKDAKKRR